MILAAALTMRLAMPPDAFAQGAAAGGGSTANIDDNAVVARVNGKSVRVGDVRMALATVLRGRPVDAQSVALIQAEVLATLIDRYLVQKALGERLVDPKSDEVNGAIDRIKSQTSAQMTFDEFLKQQGLTEQTLREQIAWQATWTAYLEEHMTDEVIEEFFREHRKDYDGTELRASHILLRPLNIGDDEQTKEMVQKATRLREQIENGEISFEDAAKKYSDGPSKTQGGDVGYFPRTGVMEESFSRTAFGLEKGAVSQPITTNFGVHLIRITGEKPGEKDWTDVREQLQAPVSQQLFNDLAAKHRDAAKIEFAPSLPHFKPGTRELVTDKPAAASEKKPSADKRSTGAKKSSGEKSGTKKSPGKDK